VKGVAALLVLILSGALAAPVTCVGWEPTPSHRRECCLRAAHQHCQDQTSADACCAAHEQGRLPVSAQSPESVAVSDHASALPVDALDAGSLYQPVAVLISAVYARRLHGPPIILATPLRI
jgi:hypothetical protein